MIRLVVVFVMAMCVSLVSWGLLDSFYSHTYFASVEAQKSLEVTETQTAELLASRFKSDLIAFGLFSALLGAMCGACCVPRRGTNQAITTSVIGLLMGLVGGLIGAWLGHFHDANIPFEGEPMVYWFSRWSMILVPIGIASGLAAQWASAAKLSDGMVAGVLGAVIASLLYCLTFGSLTPLETHQEIYPAHSSNRLLALSIAAVCVSLMIAFQLNRLTKKSLPPNETSNASV